MSKVVVGVLAALSLGFTSAVAESRVRVSVALDLGRPARVYVPAHVAPPVYVPVYASPYVPAYGPVPVYAPVYAPVVLSRAHVAPRWVRHRRHCR